MSEDFSTVGKSKLTKELSEDGSRRLPMFPLGLVLFPSGVLPLQLFEERYRQMIRDVLDADRQFGVTLIRRGSEVGGGDERCEVGTVARVAAARQFGDGRWAVVALGLQRIRVERWLPESPYPLAEVQLFQDEEENDLGAETVQELLLRTRRVLAALSELGEKVPPVTIEVSSDLGLATFQLAGIAPIAVQDRQRILETSTAGERSTLLKMLIEEAQEVADLRLSSP